MNIKDKLKEIMKLAKECNGKNVSELTETEAHAVAFCSEFHPAYIGITGTPKYSKESEQVTLSPTYMELRKITRAVDPTIKGFSADSYHVYADVELPRFKEHNVKSALECYPNILYIPTKKCSYDHLPRLQRTVAAPYASVEELKLGIVSIIAQIDLALKEGYDMAPALLAAHYEIQRDSEQALKVAKSIKYDIQNILETEASIRPKGKVDYSALNSESSYLATFLFMASKGVILKVNNG